MSITGVDANKWRRLQTDEAYTWKENATHATAATANHTNAANTAVYLTDLAVHSDAPQYVTVTYIGANSTARTDLWNDATDAQRPGFNHSFVVPVSATCTSMQCAVTGNSSCSVSMSGFEQV